MLYREAYFYDSLQFYIFLVHMGVLACGVYISFITNPISRVHFRHTTELRKQTNINIDKMFELLNFEEKLLLLLLLLIQIRN
ncbi:hypothetical protein BLOT_013194 [Blomia tropicalis]|nr:hypothetical protein BLOT_013194 [Blomia tropicalis]